MCDSDVCHHFHTQIAASYLNSEYNRGKLFILAWQIRWPLSFTWTRDSFLSFFFNIKSFLPVQSLSLLWNITCILVFHPSIFSERSGFHLRCCCFAFFSLSCKTSLGKHISLRGKIRGRGVVWIKKEAWKMHFPRFDFNYFASLTSTKW